MSLAKLNEQERPGSIILTSGGGVVLRGPRIMCTPPFFTSFGKIMASTVKKSKSWNLWTWSTGRRRGLISAKFLQTSTPTGNGEENNNVPSSFLRKDNKIVPDSGSPSVEDINLLHQFINQSTKLMVLTGAGMSTECGIPDYRSPNGAYDSGYKPITHQDFIRSVQTRKQYWARSFAGWRQFAATQPRAAHFALNSLEKAGRINFMVTQNVDGLHHRAGSNPLELHGTAYSVVCLDCGFSVSRYLIQDQLKELNPKWASAIESLDYVCPGSDKSFGMKQRPDGDTQIDKKLWEEDFNILTCSKCNGMLKPDIVFFGGNVPKDKADRAMEAAKDCDAFLALGSSLMTMSAYQLVRAAHEAGAATAIVNLGKARADNFVPLKINVRLGEILPRVLDLGSITRFAC